MADSRSTRALVTQARVQIRVAELRDAAEIVSILSNSFAEFVGLYTPEGYAATTPNPEQVRQRMAEGPIWVAALDGGIVGTGSAV